MTPRRARLTTVVIGAALCLAWCGHEGASAATVDWLKIARKFKDKAVEKLKEGRAPGTEGNFEAKQAVNSLKMALKLLQKYEEPVPKEVRDEISAINALIYWTYKTSPPGAFAGTGGLPRAVNPAGRTKEELALDYFEKARAYARANPKKHFIIAVRYFEIADRFRGTEVSLQAQKLSLIHQGLDKRGGGAVDPVGVGVPVAPARDEAAALGELIELLRSAGRKEDKAKACGEHVASFPQSERRDEIEALGKVYSARSADGTIGAWVDYWAGFPKGSLAEQALAELRRSRQGLRLQIKLAFVAKDLDRTRKLGQAYLQVFPRAADTAEVRSLLNILKASTGAARSRLVRNHMRIYARGAFNDSLKGMLSEWDQKAEKKSFERLLARFTETRVRTDLLGAVTSFLRAHPTSARVTEVKALRSVLSLENARARLVAARKYIESYPGGAFAEVVRGFEADLGRRHENDLYRAAMEGARGRETYAARLAATEKYLEEFTEGKHADEVRRAAGEIKALIAEERRAFDELVGSIEKLGTGRAKTEQGLRLCEVFIRKYPGGAHLSGAISRRGGLQRRLKTEMEAAAFEALTEKLRGRSLARLAKARECLGFLERYGHGKHAGVVSGKLKTLAAARLGVHAGPVRAAVFSRDSKLLVTVDADRGVRDSGLRIWSIPGGSLNARYRSRPRFSCSSVAFSPQSSELWLGEASGGLIAWDIPGGGITGRYRLGSSPVRAVSANGDSRAATAFLGDPKVRVWSSADWSLEATAFCPGGASAAAMNPTGSMVVVGGCDGRLMGFNVGDRDPVWSTLGAHGGEVGQLAYSPNGLYVASCSSEDGTVALWNASSGNKLWKAEDSSAGIAFASDEAILTGTGLRSVGKGGLIVKLGGGGPVAASRDGVFAFTSDEGGKGTLWYLPALLWR